jgi:hypothetical protein
VDFDIAAELMLDVGLGKLVFKEDF